MSQSTSISIKCPNCGESQKFTLWNSINADIDPTLKDSLINRNLQQTDCEACGHKAIVNYPMLYHDMGHKTLVYHLAELEQSDLEQEDFENQFEGYQFRVVKNWKGLIEKIKLLDANLGDKAMELFKMVILGELGASADTPLYFDEFMSNPEGNPVLCFVLVEDETIRSFSVPSEAFSTFELQVSNYLKKLETTDNAWETVDRSFAKEIIYRDS